MGYLTVLVAAFLAYDELICDTICSLSDSESLDQDSLSTAGSRVGDH